MNLHSPLHCRPVEEHDNLEALTVLIRSAYAPHAASGLRYWATHQSVEDTAKRLAAGHGFVATYEDRVVATVTLREFRTDREAYTEGKSAFIESVLMAASNAQPNRPTA